jgi:hypothetical protein
MGTYYTFITEPLNFKGLSEEQLKEIKEALEKYCDHWAKSSPPMSLFYYGSFKLPQNEWAADIDWLCQVLNFVVISDEGSAGVNDSRMVRFKEVEKLYNL